MPIVTQPPRHAPLATFEVEVPASDEAGALSALSVLPSEKTQPPFLKAIADALDREPGLLERVAQLGAAPPCCTVDKMVRTSGGMRLTLTAYPTSG
jgi:hypothetical protein